MTEINVPRTSKLWCLFNLKWLGVCPNVVIDVGAQIGTFELYACFPESKHLLIEPVKENEPQLAEICSKLGDAEIIIAAAAKEPGTVDICITPNFRYAAIADSINDTTDNIYRKVPGITLDNICRERGLEGPFLIKIDVDGREVDVLKGAVNILKKTECVIVESTLFGNFYDVLDFMKTQGFVVYDIVDHLHRPFDMALWQVDLAFVKEESVLRKFTGWATEEVVKTMHTC